MNHTKTDPATERPTAETVLLDGEDALAFAQAQFGSDTRTLDVGHWQWSCWLDAKGRVRALFLLARTAPRQLMLLLRGGRAEALVAAIRPYLMRAHARIEALPARALVDGGALEARCATGSGDDVTFGFGTYSMKATRDALAPTQDWRLAEIRSGHPWLPEGVEAPLPPALSLQRLGAVSLAKGCFPGQEIVSRLHYRGGAKHHLHHVRMRHPVAPGSILRADAVDAGTVLDCMATDEDAEALAVIRDAAATPGEHVLTAGIEGAQITVLHRFDR